MYDVEQIATKLFDLSSEAIMITDAENVICEVNNSFQEITGFISEEVIGKNPSVLSSGQHDDAFYEELWSELEASGNWQGELWNRKKNGEIYVEWARISKVESEEGQTSGYIAVFSDVTKARKRAEEAFRQANFDVLTGLPNRALLKDRTEQAITSCARDGESLAILFIDLDGFKAVNDTMGHDSGDQLLKIVSKRIRECVRGSDTVARIGGDEFVVLLPRIDTSMDAGSVSDKIIKAISEPYQLDHRNAVVSSSVGIAIFPDDGVHSSELLRKADVAMYQAKRNGKSNFQFFVPSLDESNQSKVLANWDIKDALAKQQFRTNFQPILQTRNGEVIGAEALVSWVHPQLGRVSPEVFIPLAEESGLIDDIGEFVLAQSCRLLKHVKSDQRPSFRVNVNVSPRQLRRSDAGKYFAELVEREGVKPSDIVLELTENVFLTDQRKTKGTLEQLVHCGFGLALDDFGTGYSSLAWLSEFPFETMKIDKSFVQGVSLSEQKRGLVEAMISIGQKLELNVVAEGVETIEQRRFVEEAGCNKLQGFLYSPAVASNDFLELPSYMPLDGYALPESDDYSYLKWTDELSVGNPQLDSDHRELIRLFNRFFDSLALRTGEELMLSLFDDLVDLAQRHFRREEAVMRAIEFPTLAEHLRVHRSLENTLVASRDRIARFDGNFERDTFRRFLTNWLMNHIMHEDKEYSELVMTGERVADEALATGAS